MPLEASPGNEAEIGVFGGSGFYSLLKDPREMWVETPYGATICAMVARGLGVGVVNPLATSDTNPARIVFRPFSPDVMFRGFTVCPQLQHPNLLATAFLDLTRETMAAEVARLRGPAAMF